MNSNSEKKTATDHFRTILATVVGQAFEAAGYTMEDSPVKQAGGLFRYRATYENGLYGFIEFQFLYLPTTEWSGNIKSRFRVSLVRTDQPNAQARSQHPDFARKTLSELVVNDFGVPILPSPNHWWHFNNTDELGRALAEAGHLAIGYGMPWLSGDLKASSE
ncbi:MAG: hypothetical protein AAF787_09440 [Chloroflexota bacterium]